VSVPIFSLFRPLHFAAQQNNIRIVQLLLDRDADVDASDCGATPLHRAGGPCLALFGLVAARAIVFV